MQILQKEAIIHDNIASLESKNLRKECTNV